MTKICKTSVEKPRKSSRSTNSPYKKVTENDSKMKCSDPIILLSDPSSEDEKANCILNNSDLDDFISAYYSESETEEKEEVIDNDPNGDAAYYKLIEMLRGFLSDLENSDIESDNENESINRRSRRDSREHSNSITREHNNSDNENQSDNHIAADDIRSIRMADESDEINPESLPVLDLENDALQFESDFIEMIESISHVLTIKYIVKVLDYVRDLQLTTSNDQIKKRIAVFFKYVNEMPNSEIRKDCDELKEDLIELGGAGTLEDFPQSGVILVDLINEKNNGLSKLEISKLSSYKYTGPTQNKCCICLGDVEKGDEVIKLHKCSHEYHAGCLVSWLKISNQCPICRNAVN